MHQQSIIFKVKCEVPATHTTHIGARWVTKGDPDIVACMPSNTHTLNRCSAEESAGIRHHMYSKQWSGSAIWLSSFYTISVVVDVDVVCTLAVRIRSFAERSSANKRQESWLNGAENSISLSSSPSASLRPASCCGYLSCSSQKTTSGIFSLWRILFRFKSFAYEHGRALF